MAPEKHLAIPVERLDRLIYEIRGYKVMLDADLAAVYAVPTRTLNQAVKRNRKKFPPDFMFQLTMAELESIRSQIATGSNRSQIVIGSQKHRDPRYLPYAFTDYGAIMVANVLNSPRAAQMSVFVVRAFVKMRAALSDTRELARKLAALEKELKDRLDVHEAAIVTILQRVMDIIDPPALPEAPPKKGIGFQVKKAKGRFRTTVVRRLASRLIVVILISGTCGGCQTQDAKHAGPLAVVRVPSCNGNSARKLEVTSAQLGQCPDGHRTLKDVPIAYGTLPLGDHAAMKKWDRRVRHYEVVAGGCVFIEGESPTIQPTCTTCGFGFDAQSGAWWRRDAALSSFRRTFSTALHTFPIPRAVESPIYEQAVRGGIVVLESVSYAFPGEDPAMRQRIFDWLATNQIEALYSETTQPLGDGHRCTREWKTRGVDVYYSYETLNNESFVWAKLSRYDPDSTGPHPTY
jgi:hypothetical protein